MSLNKTLAVTGILFFVAQDVQAGPWWKWPWTREPTLYELLSEEAPSNPHPSYLPSAPPEASASSPQRLYPILGYASGSGISDALPKTVMIAPNSSAVFSKEAASSEVAPASGPNPQIFHLTADETVEVLEEFIQKNGQDVVHQMGLEDNTALHLAAFLGKVEQLKVLLREGAKPNQQNIHGMTPFLLAVAYRRNDVIYPLLNRADVDLWTVDKRGRDAIHFAAEEGLPEVLESLLEAKLQLIPAEVDQRLGLPDLISLDGSDYWTQFEKERNRAIAAEKVKFINRRYSRLKNETLLMAAAQKGQVEAARVLIRNGAEVDAQDEEGKTALRIAAELGHRDFVKLLLKRTRTDIADQFGITPVMAAKRRGHQEIVNLLEDLVTVSLNGL